MVCVHFVRFRDYRITDNDNPVNWPRCSVAPTGGARDVSAERNEVGRLVEQVENGEFAFS
jgi:hypothetical protein